MLEFRHLHLLVALREHGSLANASEVLHLTPSALSHQLKEIENYYELSLVNRRTRPVSFTQAGKEVLKLADKILPDVANTKANIKRLADGQLGRLRLASECHSCFDWLMPVLNQYRKQFPDVELDFASGFEPEPHEMLVNEEIDVLITTSNLTHDKAHKALQYYELFTYESRLVVAPTHPLAKKEFIVPEDLEEETLIVYPVEQNRLDIIAKFLAPADITPKKIRTTDLTPMLVQLVASERGVSALPDWVVADYENKGWVVSKPMKNTQKSNGVYCQLYAGIRKSDDNQAFMQGFVELLIQMVDNKNKKPI